MTSYAIGRQPDGSMFTKEQAIAMDRNSPFGGGPRTGPGITGLIDGPYQPINNRLAGNINPNFIDGNKFSGLPNSLPRTGSGITGFIDETGMKEHQDRVRMGQAPQTAPAVSAQSLYDTIGRQGEQEGLDYWNNEIATRGIDAVKNSFAAAGADTANIATAVNSGFYDTGYQTGDAAYQQGNAINLSDYAKNIGANNNAVNRSYNSYDTRNNTIEEELALDPNVVNTAPLPQQSGPPTGLIGSEDALRRGLIGGVAGITEGVNTGRADINTGINLFNNYANQGNAALNLMGAQSGAQGRTAQQTAFDNFVTSPEQKYLQEQGERAVMRNQAAIGGLGGGNVQQELQRQAMGLAQQDFANQYNRLGGLSDLGMQGSGVQANLQNALGDMAYGGGLNAGNMAYGTGNNLASGRTRAGEQIAGNLERTTSALSTLYNQQGAGMADMIGGQSSNLANIIQNAAQTMGLSQQQLGQLTSAIETGMATQIAGLPSVPANSSGWQNVAALMHGGGTAMQAGSSPSAGAPAPAPAG